MRWVLRATVVMAGLMFLAACTGGDHKTPFNRTLQGLNDSSGNPEGGLLAKASTDKSCLNIDAVSKKLTEYQDVVTVYTSDLDLGKITGGKGGGDSCIQFDASATDDLDRASAFMKTSADLQPRKQNLMAGDLVANSWIGSLLATASQDACKTVTLTGQDIAPAGTYNVICHTSNSLTIQATGPSGLIISYFLGQNSLTISYFTSAAVANACPSSKARSYVMKNTTVVSWANGTSKLKVRRRFANLLNTYLAKPPGELKTAVTLPKASDPNKKPVAGDQIDLSVNAYDYILGQVAAQKFSDKLTCPAK